MANLQIPLSTLGALRQAGAYIADLATPTVRLGVTGLARAGKTVFITALVRNLVAGGHLPFFGPATQGRIRRAYLEPQPDDDLPRFAYEEHLAALTAEPPHWPESTRRISQLRLTIEYEPTGLLKRHLGANRLHVDIIDYPGEWLIDLAMLDADYATWAAQALAAARDPRRAAPASAFLAFLAACPPVETADEQKALTGAEIFRTYLAAARAASPTDLTLGPGRFLMPGDLAGSPLLTFLPLDLATGEPIRRGSLAAMMARRYEAYRDRVVRPFFRDHFARLDRQIVLVDALAALAAGPAAIADLEGALTTVLGAFRPGSSRWLSALLPRRIDRIVLAATKADHLHHTSHDGLELALARITQRAAIRARFAGAEVKSLALAALRSTREAEVRHRGEMLSCLVGTPMAGERIGAQVFDGATPHRVFPGALEATRSDSGSGAAASDLPEGAADLALVRFQPTRVPPDSPGGQPAPWPHIRLDRALDFLIGDRLA